MKNRYTVTKEQNLIILLTLAFHLIGSRYMRINGTCPCDPRFLRTIPSLNQRSNAASTNFFIISDRRISIQLIENVINNNQHIKAMKQSLRPSGPDRNCGVNHYCLTSIVSECSVKATFTLNSFLVFDRSTYIFLTESLVLV